jgi:hypothetical protein
MITNLLLVLVLRVNDHIGDEPEENIFEKFRSENHGSPVVAKLHDVKHIT